MAVERVAGDRGEVKPPPEMEDPAHLGQHAHFSEVLHRPVNICAASSTEQRVVARLRSVHQSAGRRQAEAPSRS